MELSPFWEADSFSASQEFSRILLNSKVQFRIYKSQPTLPILSHTYRYIWFISQLKYFVVDLKFLGHLYLSVF